MINDILSDVIFSIGAIFCLTLTAWFVIGFIASSIEAIKEISKKHSAPSDYDPKNIDFGFVFFFALFELIFIGASWELFKKMKPIHYIISSAFIIFIIGIVVGYRMKKSNNNTLGAMSQTKRNNDIKSIEEKEEIKNLSQQIIKYKNELNAINQQIDKEKKRLNSITSENHDTREQSLIISENTKIIDNQKDIIEAGEKYIFELRSQYTQLKTQLKKSKKLEERIKTKVMEIARAKKALTEFKDQLETQSKNFAEMQYHFGVSYIQGRHWLAEMIAEKLSAEEEAVAYYLETKNNPAYRAAEKVKEFGNKNKQLTKQLKLLEYQLKTYQEKFPFLVEYEEEILNEELSTEKEIKAADDDIASDEVSRYIDRNEYKKLSTVERNQLALDRYLNGHLGKAAIGRLYERYIGYLYEQQGFTVHYHGIMKGFEDLGRDLICRKDNLIHIVQAKCWSNKKRIHENHICQLFGTSIHFKKVFSQMDLYDPDIVMVMITSTQLSDTARAIADALEVQYEENKLLDKSYPMIKCNISHRSGEKIYHLPFDQVYDKVVIEPDKGEMYVATVQEAEAKGFRRAFRYRGNH